MALDKFSENRIVDRLLVVDRLILIDRLYFIGSAILCDFKFEVSQLARLAIVLVTLFTTTYCLYFMKKEQKLNFLENIGLGLHLDP